METGLLRWEHEEREGQEEEDPVVGSSVSISAAWRGWCSKGRLCKKHVGEGNTKPQVRRQGADADAARQMIRGGEEQCGDCGDSAERIAQSRNTKDIRTTGNCRTGCRSSKASKLSGRATVGRGTPHPS